MTNQVVDVLEKLMDGILSGKYGVKLPPQDVLAKQLGVGRSTVREAISKLEWVNIVDSVPKSGTKINPRTKWHLVNRNVLAWYARSEKNDPDAFKAFITTLNFDDAITKAWGSIAPS